jgi:hypothetical protein
MSAFGEGLFSHSFLSNMSRGRAPAFRQGDIRRDIQFKEMYCRMKGE